MILWDRLNVGCPTYLHHIDIAIWMVLRSRWALRYLDLSYGCLGCCCWSVSLVSGWGCSGSGGCAGGSLLRNPMHSSAGSSCRYRGRAPRTWAAGSRGWFSSLNFRRAVCLFLIMFSSSAMLFLLSLIPGCCHLVMNYAMTSSLPRPCVQFPSIPHVHLDVLSDSPIHQFWSHPPPDDWLWSYLFPCPPP